MTPDGVVLQFMAPCAMGGTVAVDTQASFIGDPGDESAGMELSVTLVHSGCTERHEWTGIAFTLDGAPELEVSMELSYSAEFMVAISGAVDGTVRWATEDGRSGSCTMDVGIRVGGIRTRAQPHRCRTGVRRPDHAVVLGGRAVFGLS